MYEQIIEKVSSYLSKEEVEMFEKCYKSSTKEYASKKFFEKINAVEYIDNVIFQLTKYQVAIESLLACLLLKTDNINYGNVIREYGKETSAMLEALVKIDNVKEKIVDKDNELVDDKPKKKKKKKKKKNNEKGSE